MNTPIKSIVGGSIGNLIEWYDWYTYSVFSMYFAGAFFPEEDATAQLLNTAGIFAIGFLMRPLGGWLLGAYADRQGRKAALTLSVLLMCLGSLLIALAPGYHQIGILAPSLLVVARLIQGLSVGGEYGTVATYLSEIAPDGRKGLYSSFQYVSTTLGQLLALGVLLALQRFFLTAEQLEAWGWRIPFLIGTALALLALLLRQNLSETTDFIKNRPNAGRAGTFRELGKYRKETALVVGLTIGLTVSYYTFTTYIQKFLVNTAGFSKSDSTVITLVSLTLFMLVQPLAGWLGDRFGTKRMMIIYGVLGILTTYPLLMWLQNPGGISQAIGLITVALVILSLATSVSAIIKAELFPVAVRTLGVSLPYALTVAVFGGSAEYVALLFKQVGYANWFYGYITFCLLLTLYASMQLKPAARLLPDKG
ncbi:MFS transporter [Larkinella bovis]|uniref:MFS transporter n=1 Tax=Larkinella bovis TaxID=683041 RepID=A0ABW0IDM2_9BACT